MVTENTQAVKKMQSFEKFGSRLGLERMNILLDLLNHPEKNLKVIHVAGTNGKGSVCRYIYEALRENGYNMGLYTSPFIEIFNERIEYDGEYISDDDLNQYTDIVLECVKTMTDAGEDSPTEFEVITAVALLYFSEKPVDYVILEVGLGGRGDSTNVIKQPLIDIITSISYDHMDRLGDTLAEIAGEKAGIIKENTPVVINVEDAEARKVIAREAYGHNCVLYDVTKHEYRNLVKNLEGYSFDTQIYGTDYSGIEISMDGEHQVKNVLTALTAIEVLRKAEKVKVERSKLYEGIKRARQIGRFEIMSEDPYVILDGAHNEAGAEALAETVRTHFEGKRVLLITGMLADKDVNGILRHLLSIAHEVVATEPASPRKLSAGALCDIITKKGVACSAEPDLRRAVKLAGERAGDFDLVLYAGSLYLVGKVRGLIKNE